MTSQVSTILSRLLSLIQDPATHPLVLRKGMLRSVGATLKNDEASPADVEAAMRAIDTLAGHADCPGAVDAVEGLKSRIEHFSSQEGAVGQLASSALKKLRGESAAAAAATAAGGRPPSGRRPSAARRTRTAILDMSRRMSDRQTNDKYTRALLMVPGVTSVTMDPRARRAIVLTHASTDISAELMAALDSVRPIGATGTAGAAPQGAQYLDDEEDSAGAVFGMKRGQGTVTNNHGGSAVEQRLARRRAKAAAGGSATDGATPSGYIFSAAKAIFGF